MSQKMKLETRSKNSKPNLPEINALIGYDKARAALRAMRLLDGLVEHFRGKFRFKRNLWRFDVLGCPEAFAAAMGEITRADLIVVTANGDVELPGTVKVWLHTWGRLHLESSAGLVALLELPSSASFDESPVRCFLSMLARQTGIEFFADDFRLCSNGADLGAEGLTQCAVCGCCFTPQRSGVPVGCYR